MGDGTAAGPIALFVTFTARPGRARDLQDALLDLAEVSLREPGCDGYAVHADLADESRVWLYESWASEEALAAHDGTDHVAAFVATLPELSEAGFERWKTAPLTRP
jgi:quinol monooxygenase YgiN